MDGEYQNLLCAQLLCGFSILQISNGMLLFVEKPQSWGK